MKQEHTLIENLVSLIILAGIFIGLIWVIGRSNSINMGTLDPILSGSGGDDITLTVDHSTCRFIMPSLGEYIFGYPTCPSCMRKGKKVREEYTVTVSGGHCSRRGSDTIHLVRKT